MWGNPIFLQSCALVQGSIPTCVGQPPVNVPGQAVWKVYPHVCGATQSLARSRPRYRGLSPRVWGNRQTGRASSRRVRSIPTCVGQPSTGIGGSRVITVYPHVCGATLLVVGSKTGLRGLSPRVWGNPGGQTQRFAYAGSIPTCVGQPPCANRGLLPITVYPHVCGATSVHKASRLPMPGLSPRVWGNRETADAYSAYCRSIPTCVGQPSISSAFGLIVKVYPHVCGATNVSEEQMPIDMGLSPRVWGNQNGMNCRLVSLGSIPTCVGQPVRPVPGCRGYTVYPHVCGATAFPSSIRIRPAGLSPRVWGNPLKCVQ